jgi:TPR repeat protein
MKKYIMIALLLMGLSTSLNADISTLQGAKNACDNENAKGCFNLAFMYDFGEGVKKDSLKSIELYSKACDIGYAGGCLVLGAIYHVGEGVKKDLLKAKRLYGKACDGGNDRGCKEYSILRVNEKIVVK